MTTKDELSRSYRYRKGKAAKRRENESERLKFTITRLDHYFDSINNKAAVYLALNTFLTGGIATMMAQVPFALSEHRVFLILGIILLLLGISSLTILTFTSLPYFSKKIDSLYYFGSISACSAAMYHKLSKACTREADLTDLREQVYQLSCGLKSKFLKMKFIGILLIAQFVLLFPFLISLIFNS